MRVLAALLVLCSLSAAEQLLTREKLEDLFTKFMLNELSEEALDNFKDALEVLRRSEYATIDSIDSFSLSRMSIDCIICRSAFGALRTAIRGGQSDEDAASAITTLCIGLGIQSSSVCQGAVGLNMPIMAHIFRVEPQASADAFCSLILQRASDNVCPSDDPRFEWEVDLPEKSATPPVAVYNDRPLKVALITDAHIDPLYQAYGVAECDEPVCCRWGQRPRAGYYEEIITDGIPLEDRLVTHDGELKLNLTLASAIRKNKKVTNVYRNLRNAAPAGFWGDYRNCDTPLWAYDEAIDTIYENHNDIDIIYYVGDTIDHGVWETTYGLIDNMNRHIVEKIRMTFGEDVRVVPVIGNHEAQPTNQFAPSHVVGEKLNTTWLYQGLVNKWGSFLTDDAKQSLLEQGDFSVPVAPGLRAISLNNNVAYRDNWWLVYDPQDAKRHLDWLVGELYKAELAGEKVHILAHIPPGVHDLIHTWTREYNKIVRRFSDTISAEFNGHTHADEFKLFYNEDGQPINVAWGVGGVTTFTFYNLNYKIATFNNEYIPERITNYVYNLTEANLTPNSRPQWFLLYDMTNSFELADLSAISIHNLIYSMVTTNRRLLDLYSAFVSKISDYRWPSCDDNCKIDHLCRTVVTVLWERERCEEIRELFFR